MSHRLLIGILLIATLGWGCEGKPPGASQATTSATSASQAVAHPAPREVVLELSPDWPADAPSHDALRAALLARLSAGPMRPSPGGEGPELRWRAARMARGADGAVAWLWQCGLAREGAPLAQDTLLEPAPSPDALTTPCVSALEAQREVTLASDDQLAALLTRRDALPVSAAVMAMRRLRDAERSQDAAALRPWLASDHLEATLTAAGLLAMWRDPGADRPMVEAAERVSRLGASPHYATLLTLLGDLGSPEATRYLTAVRDGHADAQVREVASQALERAKRRPEAP